jgi:phage minor structural protein, N-terminal region
MATAYLATVNKPLVSYEFEVVELKAAAGYDESESFRLGDTVHGYDEALKMAVTARIIDYTEYPLEPERSKVTLANFKPDLTDALVGLEDARDRINNVTTGDGGVRSDRLEGAINTLKNQLRASGAYATAEVLENEGYLLENTDKNSPDYGALYLGPGIFALASEKSGGGDWNWRTFGTGKGFTGDEITAGLIRAEFVQIGPGTTFEDGYDPSVIDSTLRSDLRLSAPLPTSITMSEAGIRASSADPKRYAQLDYRGLYIAGGAIQIDGGLPDSQVSGASGWNSKTTRMTSEGIYTGTVQANQVNADTLSAISANLGTITAGSIFGAYINGTTIDGGTITGALIRTAASGTRVELTSSLVAYYDDNNFIRMNPTYSVRPGVEFWDSGSLRGILCATPDALNIYGVGDIRLAPLAGNVRFTSWSSVYSDSPLQSLQNALDGKANLFHTHNQSDISGLASSLATKANYGSSTSSATGGGHNHAIPDGTRLAIWGTGNTVSGYVTWSAFGGWTHSHTQN